MSVNLYKVKIQKVHNMPILKQKIQQEVTSGRITQTCQCNILQYFTGVKMINFQIKNCGIFLIFA